MIEISQVVGDIEVSCSSWNVAAVNNNPFEYWVSYPDNQYDELMRFVQEFVNDNNRDVPVSQIFTEQMFSELNKELESMEDQPSLKKLQTYWTDDFSKRPSITGFLKDKALGTKRLTSMPDRITNTINLADGSLCTRPSAISSYQGPSIGSIEKWWPQWKHFMFHHEVVIFGKGDKSKSQLVCRLLSPILRSKYPAITVEEQEISVQLQILCLAILDAIFIYILSSAESISWEDVKKTLCDSLIFNKAAKTCQIIAQSYAETDVFFIQEAAAIFVQRATENETLSAKYAIVKPTNIDGKRNQNSLILLRKSVFEEGSLTDITQGVVDSLDGVFITAGDLLAVTVQNFTGQKWLLVSFHGDSNGLSTQPVMMAIVEMARAHFSDHWLLCGLDANTHSLAPDQFHHSVDSFASFLEQNAMTSLWGSPPDTTVRTAFSCRTYLQTQLNKAVPMVDRLNPKHQNLKDWIVVRKEQISCFASVERDNMGLGSFSPSTVLPSVAFPSDHSIISTTAKFSTRSVAGQDIDFEAAGASEAFKQTSQSFKYLPFPRGRPAKQAREQKTLYDFWGITEKPLASALPCGSIALSHSDTDSSFIASALCSVASLQADPEMKPDDHRERLFCRLVSKPDSNDLDRLNMLLSTSEDRSIWILFGKRPVSMALCKTWFRALMFIMGLTFLADFLLNTTMVFGKSKIYSSAFRFVPLSLRNGSQVLVQPPSIHSVGVLQDGVLHMEVPVSDSEGPYVVVNLTIVHEIDGLFVVTGDGPIELDPVEYRWDMWSEPGGWKSIDYPSWLLRYAVNGLPVARSAVKVISVKPPNSWIVDAAFGSALLAFSYIFAAVLGEASKANVVIFPFAMTYHFFIFVHIWRAFETGESTLDDPEWLVPLIFGLEEVLLVCFASIVYTQQFHVDLFLIAMVCDFPAKLLIILNFEFGSSEFVVRLVIFLCYSAVLLVLAVAVVIVRQLTFSWVLRTLLKADRERYNGAWKATMSDADERESIYKLQNISLNFRQPRIQLRQLQRRSSASVYRNHLKFATWHLSLPWSKSTQSNDTPLTSLDQLYDQAVCLDYYLKQKVVSWAKHSNGHFRVSEPTQYSGVRFASWQEILDIRAKGSNPLIHWTELKSPERALEKLLRSYDCDVSMLLDCCRESLHFNNAADLVRCVDMILSDRDISVLRMKNRMDPATDAFYTGGFRMVALNLCIHSEETRQLGVDRHVCELMLTLTNVSRLLDNRVHSRYLILRNCRDAPYLCKAMFNTASRVYRFFKSLCSRRISPVLYSTDALTGSSKLFDNRDCTFDNVEGLGAGSCERKAKPVCKMAHECRTVMEQSVFHSLTALRGRPDGLLGKDSLLIQALEQSADVSIWCTCRPFTAAFFRAWMPACVFMFALFALLDISITAHLVAKDRLIYARYFRFTALQLRDNEKPLDAPGISTFSVYNKADLPITHRREPDNISIFNSSYLISFQDPLWMNGWWFETAYGSIDGDAVRYSLDCSMDGHAWSQVGSSTELWTWDGSLRWTDGYRETIGERGRPVNFDSGVQWPWSAAHFSIGALSVVSCAIYLFAWTKKRAGAAKLSTCLALLGSSGVHITQFAVCMWAGQLPMACTAIIQSAILFTTSGLIWYREGFLLHWCMISGILLLVNVVTHHAISIGDLAGLRGQLGIILNQGFLIGIALIILSLHGYAMQWIFCRSTRSNAQPDRCRYDACWNEVVHLDWQLGVLNVLAQRVRDIRALCPKHAQPPRQRIQPERVGSLKVGESAHVVTVEPATSGPEDRLAVQGEMEPQGALVQSLDQLFAQAALVDVLLRDKLTGWAHSSRGLARIVSGGTHSFVLWSELVGKDGEEKLKQVQFASKKNFHRAIEKVDRRYDGDVSRLLDVCRQSLFFSRLEDLVACLDVLKADREVRIERVVNQLDPAYDGSLSLGYRAVVVNLRLDTPFTRRLAVDTHICELKLELTAFAELMTNASNARYLRWKKQRRTAKP